uniref:Uncharacterized protein n=1 Tax=Favella ehrenbergii TaxID=182087 RepID=A0A7S3I4V2_9SPIT|mmetsp:Transcript_33473/g.41315  ORF Transcript_33473/g.41315 Transcript_33473/m.41315 type:complete len:129 (+) Transcript_33473:37-423(+)
MQILLACESVRVLCSIDELTLHYTTLFSQVFLFISLVHFLDFFGCARQSLRRVVNRLQVGVGGRIGRIHVDRAWPKHVIDLAPFFDYLKHLLLFLMQSRVFIELLLVLVLRSSCRIITIPGVSPSGRS